MLPLDSQSHSSTKEVKQHYVTLGSLPSSYSDHDTNILPKVSLSSSTSSISSCSTKHYKTTTTLSDAALPSPSSSRHFYSSNLGRPPGQQQQQQHGKQVRKSISATTGPNQTSSSIMPTASSSYPMTSMTNKTVPMKELQKIIADLKKENFDLKLRLYHLEQLLEKDLEKSWLTEENKRLQMELDERTTQVNTLEQALETFVNNEQKTTLCDASTQTITIGLASLIPSSTSSKSAPLSAPATFNNNNNQCHFFPSDPESFGLTSSIPPPSQTTKGISHPPNTKDWAIMVDRFQNVKIVSPKPPKSKYGTTEQNDRISGWIDRIPFPSFLSNDPLSNNTSSSSSSNK
ncbi:uncharacterized protein BX664DRAFT_361120 [Halteromyces radiatus]|uniref:uncharacterized protein n=1 Tax=Halteromyces radiatus TaxID=101107 RepID=UPI00221FB1AC|nr:uncharacterized protein BX664DRAFT_361120 [Halteromyces radiatus]KAI8082825.1 hypothetical protein BX664DRAFT_361120 [Halteromyces radiatus]